MEQTTFPSIRPPVRLTSAEPVKVLADCKKAALKADVSFRWWQEFSDTARACLTPDCEPEELVLFMAVVKERFEVTESFKAQDTAPAP